MKRIIAIFSLCAVLLLSGGGVAAGQNLVEKYGNCLLSETINVSRKMFYSMMPMMGFDKDTKQLMKNLNVGKIVYLNMIKCNDIDKEAIDADVREAVESGKFVAMDSKSVDEGRISVLFYVDNDHIKQMMIYTPAPETSLIQINCYAGIQALTTLKPASGSTPKEN